MTTFTITSKSALLEATQNQNPICCSRLELNFDVPQGVNAIAIANANTVHVAYLACLLNKCRTDGTTDARPGRLVELRMSHVRITGNLAPFLLAALIVQQKLQLFHCEFCMFDPILVTSTLMQLPALKILILHGHISNAPIPMTRMTQLVQRGIVKDLLLDPMRFANLQEATDFLEAVGESSQMRRLLCNVIGLPGFSVEHVAQMLKSSKSLQECTLHLGPRTSMEAIAKSIESNSSLVKLIVQVATDPSPKDLKPFQEALHSKNFTLQELSIAKRTGWDLFRRQRVPLYDSPETREAYTKLEFYLALNKSGRKSLLFGSDIPCSVKDWLPTIANQEDPSVIFYYAQRNPLMILPRDSGGWLFPPTEDEVVRAGAQREAKYAYLFRDHADYGVNTELYLTNRKQVCDALACDLSPVKSLRLEFPTPPTHIVHADELAKLISRYCQNLERLVIVNVRLVGDTDCVLESLKRALSVKSYAQLGTTMNPERVVEALSGLSKFDTLQLEGEGAGVTFRRMTHLLRKRPMKLLIFQGLPFQCSSINYAARFFALVGQSTTLQHLQCASSRGGFTESNMDQIGNALRVNTSLRVLELTTEISHSILPFAAALKANNVLVKLGICFRLGLPRRGRIEDFNAFQAALDANNTSLEQIDLKESVAGSFRGSRPLVLQGDEEQDILENIKALLAQNRRLRQLKEREDRLKEREERIRVQRQLQRTEAAERAQQSWAVCENPVSTTTTTGNEATEREARRQRQRRRNIQNQCYMSFWLVLSLTSLGVYGAQYFGWF